MPPLSPASQPLTFDQLVSGALVHRRHLSDVLVTGAVETGPDRFDVGVQWPVNHILLGRGPDADASLVAESIRQASAYVAHTGYAVPMDRQFLLSRLSVEVHPEAPSAESAPGLVVRIDFEPARRSDASLASFVSRARILGGDRELATGAAYSRLVPGTTYARTRAATRSRAGDAARLAAAPMPIAAARVGVVNDGLVVVGETVKPGIYEIIVDPSNHAFFDHDVDHVPGMVLLEAARQAVRDAAGRPGADFEVIDLEFSRIVELDRPAWVVLPTADRSSGAAGPAAAEAPSVAVASARAAREEASADPAAVSTLVFEQDGVEVAVARYRVRAGSLSV